MTFTFLPAPAPAPATLGPGTKNSPYQSLQSGAGLVSAGHCPCGHNTQIIDTTPHQTAHGICPAQDWMIETERNTETFSQFRNYDFTNNLNTLPIILSTELFCLFLDPIGSLVFSL